MAVKARSKGTTVPARAFFPKQEDEMKPRKTTASWRRWKSIAVAASTVMAASAVVLAGTVVSSNMAGQPDVHTQVHAAEEARPSFLSELPERTAEALQAGVIAPTTITEDASLRTVVASLSVAPAKPEPAAAVAEEADDLELFRVTTNGLNVRSAPSGDSGKLLVLKQDEAVKVAEIDGSWARVTTASGDSGWAFMRYLAPAE